MNGISFRCGADIWLQELAINDIDWTGEELRDEIFKPDVRINVSHSSRRDLNHNVDIAVRPCIAARVGSKERGMCDAPSPQSGLVLAEDGDDLVASHEM